MKILLSLFVFTLMSLASLVNANNNVTLNNSHNVNSYSIERCSLNNTSMNMSAGEYISKCCDTTCVCIQHCSIDNTIVAFEIITPPSSLVVSITNIFYISFSPNLILRPPIV